MDSDISKQAMKQYDDGRSIFSYDLWYALLFVMAGGLPIVNSCYSSMKTVCPEKYAQEVGALYNKVPAQLTV